MAKMMQWKVGVMDKFQRYFSREEQQIDSCSDDDDEDEDLKADFAAKESKLFGFNRQQSYNHVSTEDDSFSRLKNR